MTEDAGTLFEWLDRRQRNKDYVGVVSLLIKISEESRLAVAPLAEAYIKSIKGEAWWRPTPAPQAAGLGLIVLGTAPTAAKAAALLTRREMRDAWGAIPLVPLRDLLSARQMPWLGDVAARVAERLSPQNVTWSGEWEFADTLFRESGTMPPATEAVLLGWLTQMTRTRHHREKPVPVVDKLRDHPYLDLLLPAFFEIDGLGGITGGGEWNHETKAWETIPHFPLALAQLATEGRLDRAMLLTGTLDRLLRGDKPNSLRTFTALHDALAPTLDELAAHALDYARLLPDAGSPIAGLAQRALRAIDDAGRLELETLLEASAPTMLRKEKALVKAQLSWLEKVARREPGRRTEIMETVAAAFGHPALDIQERALTIVGRALPKLAPDDLTRLADQAVLLGGDLPARAAALFGVTVGSVGDDPITLPPHPPVAAMPPPIGSAAELAEEIVVLVESETAVGWERVLDAVVRLSAAGDRAALAEAVHPVLDRNAMAFTENAWIRRPRFLFLGEAVRAATSEQSGRDGKIWQKMVAAIREAWSATSLVHRAGDSPYGVLVLRISELSLKLRREPVPLLLSTPTHVTGSIDAGVLLERLRRAEAEGWTPWPFDLDQALVRVPRTVDPEVVTHASALTSTAGKAFAEMLRAGGVADPIATRVEQRARKDRQNYGEVPRRVVVTLEPAAPTGLVFERRLLHLTREAYPTYAAAEVTDVWTMTMPHHRDAVAAWALPSLAGLADLDDKGAARILPMLAECDGPAGLGLSYGLAYALGARHPSDRVAAVDAFLALAARGEPFAGGVGAALGDLAADGAVKVSRIVAPLRDIHQAGASAETWELLVAALPLLLPIGPRALPDLLELAAQVAPAAGATGTFAELEAVAGRSGTGRLMKEAKRLRDVLNR
ncbi:DUF7824 domain-containing protein [Catenuloplanes japonicus]|uniref:DUF7824 domain-containing protein n=1 Tax=Catenuloplanes japonicus TaxID=33876 RepID=UPI000527C490|nr:DUF6493 family protein [Catenuloplanes japonicus]